MTMQEIPLEEFEKLAFEIYQRRRKTPSFS